MRQLKACTDWQGVRQALEAADGRTVNHMHVAAAVTHCAQLLTARGPATDSTSGADAAAGEHGSSAADCRVWMLTVAQQLLADRHLAATGPRQLSNALWALAAASCSPHRQLIPQLLAAMQPHLLAGAAAASSAPPRGAEPPNKLSHQDLSNTLWAAAALAHDPGAQWLSAFWAATGQLLPNFSAQELSNTLYAAAVLQAAPPAQLQPHLLATVDRLWTTKGQQRQPNDGGSSSRSSRSSSSSSSSSSRQGCRRHPRSSTPSPQAVSNTLWALATLQLTPSPQRLSAWLAATRSALPSMSPQQLSNTLWALGRFGCAPSLECMLAFRQAASDRTAGFALQGLANVAAATRQLLDGLSSAQQPASDQEMAQLRQELLSLRNLVGSEVQRRGSGALSVQDAVALAWAAGSDASSGSRAQQLQVLPEAGSVKDGQQALQLLWVAARSPQQPSSEWLDVCCSAAEGHLAAASPQLIAQSIWALCEIQRSQDQSSSSTTSSSSTNTNTISSSSRQRQQVRSIKQQVDSSPAVARFSAALLQHATLRADQMTLPQLAETAASAVELARVQPLPRSFAAAVLAAGARAATAAPEPSSSSSSRSRSGGSNHMLLLLHALSDMGVCHQQPLARISSDRPIRAAQQRPQLTQQAGAARPTSRTHRKPSSSNKEAPQLQQQAEKQLRQLGDAALRQLPAVQDADKASKLIWLLYVALRRHPAQPEAEAVCHAMQPHLHALSLHGAARMLEALAAWPHALQQAGGGCWSGAADRLRGAASAGDLAPVCRLLGSAQRLGARQRVLGQAAEHAWRQLRQRMRTEPGPGLVVLLSELARCVWRCLVLFCFICGRALEWRAGEESCGS